jgi:hypothetical protein
MVDAASSQIKTGESRMPFVPRDRVPLNAMRPNRAEHAAGKEDQGTDNKHRIMPDILEKLHGSNETKMSDGGRDRASLEVEMGRSSQKWSAQRSAVRSIAWLGVWRGSEVTSTNEEFDG